MSVIQWLQKAKIQIQRALGTTDSRAKVPRKKLQIQFKEAITRFDQEVESLRHLLSTPILSPSARHLAHRLIQDVERFKEVHLIRINQNRLNNLPRSFIPPTDLSLWVLYQMYALTEEIYYFVDTARS